LKRKTGVLIHGYSLLSANWEEVVWGFPAKDSMGRLPKGILTAIEEEAMVLVFGTGSSEKDGKIEAAWMRDTVFERFEWLTDFSVFKGQEAMLERSKNRLEKISVLEIESKNTRQEIKFAFDIFLEKGINEVIIISSPDHISRCLRDALAIVSEDKKFIGFSKRLSATPSEVPYSGPASEVIIIEPGADPKKILAQL